MSLELQSHLMMASVDFGRLQAFVQLLRIKLDADGALFRYLDFNDWSYPITLHCGSGIFNQQFFDEYDGGWGVQDPHIRVGVNRQLPERTAYICSEFYPPENRHNDPYFRDFLPRYNIKWFAGYMAQVDNQLGAGFGVVRSPGKPPFTPEDGEYLRSLINIIDDCVRMLLNGQRQKLIIQAMKTAFQHNVSDALCVDAQARLLWHTDSAGQLIEKSDDLSINDGRLVSRGKNGDALIEKIQIVAKKSAHAPDTDEELLFTMDDGLKIALQAKSIKAEEGSFADGGLGACLLLGAGGGGGGGMARRQDGALSVLTPAELEVAVLIADGMTAPQIAKLLGVKPSTVRTHMKHAYRKLRINSKTELAALYIKSQKSDD